MRPALVLLLLALPASAQAATVEIIRSNHTTFSAPALAGDSVVVTSFPGNGTIDVIAGGPNAGGRRLLRVTAPYSSVLPTAAGGRVLARVNYESGASDLYGGPLAGPLTKLESCPQNPNLSFPPPPALDGDLSAWSAANCVRDRIHIQLGAVSRTVDANGYVHALAAAGRHVAWLSNQPSGNPQVPDSRRLTVYDAQAGQTAYTLLVEPTDQFDVQSDGTIALMQFDSGADRRPCHGFQQRVTYFTVAQPVAHTLPASSCFQNVRIAAGRIAFVEHLANGGDRLELTNLAGTQVQPVARLDAKPTPIPQFDYDGTHVAWTQTRCRDDVVLRRDASDTSAEDAPVTCPVRVGSPRLSRDGTLHVAVACTKGCRPVPGARQQGIEIVSPRWLHVLGKDRRGNTRYSPFVKVDLQAGRRTVVRLPLTSHQRALLRRRGQVAIRLKVLLQNVYLPRLPRTAHAGRGA